MTITNNQINSNLHKIAITDANGLITGLDVGSVQLADAANLVVGGGSAGQALITDGTGNLSWATVDTGNVANAGYANIAGEAYSVAGSNVTGQVANAAVADSALSVAGANVSGQVGSAASADVALSVAGANVSGAVANATFATSAGSATTAGTANSVAGANVSGTVANATFATSAGSATVADSANSVSLANVVGAGNIASINLNGNASQVLAGDGTWTTVDSANAAYANAAGEAYSVAGANVSGQVANAASSDVALSVAGSNVSGQVANATFATTAGTANSVSRNNVSGVTGIGGQVQFGNITGNLSSSERYWFGGNGTTALNVSRDAGTGTILAGYSYYNATSAGTVFFSRARGTKAAPLPVQVGDRVFSTLGQIYTGTGSATADGIAGWSPISNTPAFSADVTALPLSNTGTYSSKLRFNASNAVINGTVSMEFNDDGTLDTPKLRVNNSTVPASATATGTRGEISWDADFMYVCIATNTWKRSALTTW